MNPLWGALFFSGLVECWRRWRRPFIRWTVLGLGLCLLPGFASTGFELFRVLQVLPFLVLIAGLGMGSLLSSLPRSKRAVGAWIILILSSLLDCHHLWGPYHEIWGKPGPHWADLKSTEFWRAYEILKQPERVRGPGVLLNEFRTNVGDQTLAVAAYSMDMARHAKFSLQGVRWIGVVLDIHYKTFLARKFPRGQWYWLGSNHLTRGGIMLAIIPTDEKNLPVLQRWCEANRLLYAGRRVTLH